MCHKARDHTYFGYIYPGPNTQLSKYLWNQ